MTLTAQILLLPVLLALQLQLRTSALYLKPDSYAPCSYITGDVNILDCTAKDLADVPGIDPAMPVSVLYLDANPIVSIGPRAFANVTGTLNLLTIKSTASMDRIDAAAFAGLSVLKTLTVEAAEGSESAMNKVQISSLLSGLTALNSLRMSKVNVNELPISFAGTTSLTDLALVRTAIATIDRYAFSNASKLRTLDLSQNALLSGSTNWLGAAASLETCVLSSCEITTSYLGQIPALPRLKRLDLRNNRLHRLVSNSLENVAGTLEDLVLSTNAISEANTDGLAGLTALKKLAMSNNDQLTSIPPQVKQLPGLELLEFRATSIAGIDAGAFHPNAKLKTLQLDYTRVSSLHALAFARLSDSLEEFTLSASNLHNTIIQDAAGRQSIGNWSIILDQLPALQILSLSGPSGSQNGGLGNTIWSSLTSLKQLRRLSLDFNRITSLPDFYLAQFAHLNYLSLYGNNVSTMTSAALYNKGGMQLELQDNAISVMDNCTLAMYTNVSGIDLTGNPFNCNCALQWLWQRVKSDRPLKLPTTSCAQPASLAGRIWSSLTAADFCSPGEVPPHNCSVITPTTPPEPGYLLSITVAKASDSSVSLEANVAKLAGQFHGYIVKYWPVAKPETTTNSSRLSITTGTVTLQVMPNELYRFCYVLLNDTAAVAVDNPANCRDFALQGLASAAIIAIVVLAAIIGVGLIFVLVCLLCKRCRVNAANKANIQGDDEDPYTYTYPDEKEIGGKRTKKKKTTANGSATAGNANSQFQATLRPESKRFSKRSRNNLAGSRPSLATSTTTLAASRLSSPGFAVPNGSRPVSDHATASAMQQQQQQQQQQQSSRSLHSIADEPPANWRHHQLSRSQDHLSHHPGQQSQQRMLPPPPSVPSHQPLRQARSQELVLDVTRVSSQQPLPQPPPQATRLRQPLSSSSPGDYLPMSGGPAAASGYTDMIVGESSTDDHQHGYPSNYNDYVPDLANQLPHDGDSRGPATAQQPLTPSVRISGGVDNSAFRRNESSGYYEMGQF